MMHDHPSHSNYPMSGGMWCGTHDAIPDMEDRLKRRGQDNGAYLADMNFLNAIVRVAHREREACAAARFVLLRRVRRRVFISDAEGGGRARGQRIPQRHLVGKVRQGDVDILMRKLK